VFIVIDFVLRGKSGNFTLANTLCKLLSPL